MENISTLRRIVAMRDYILKYREEAKFIKYCQNCKNYGSSWYCPPLLHDSFALLSEYDKIELIVFSITLSDGSDNIGIEGFHRALHPLRRELDNMLLTKEMECNGRAFSFAGRCIYCGDEPCARIKKEPCRHPEKVRPSLEAYGFNLEATLSDYFGITMEWGKNGKLPPRLHLIAGVAFS